MEKKNVLVIMADAMRADRLSYTGYRRDGKKLTPNIDQLAEKGVFYEKAYATGPWTAASQPSFLTGEYCSNMDWPAKGSPLDEEYRTIGNYFSDEGYETRAYNLSLHIRSDLGFERGFDYYEDISLKDKFEPNFWHMEGMVWNLLFGQDNRTRYATKKIGKWLESREDSRHFFTFWNPTNPHNKYEAPRKFRKKFEREVGEEMDEEAVDRVADWGHCLDYTAGNLELKDEEMDVVESRYDAEVAYLDYRVGQLIDKLKKEGVYEDTIIVFTSDHGENFGEYNRLLYHDTALNESLTRVPLVIAGGPFREDNVEKPVSLIDLPNSLLKAATGETVEEVESRPCLLPDEKKREIVHMERDKALGGYIEELEKLNPPKDIGWFSRGLQAAIKQDSKLVVDSNGEKKGFRINGFHQEKTDLNPDLVEELKESIREKLGNFSGEEKEVEEEIKDKLDKMGYL
ncbi:MAG: hypothetical protein BRC29_00775 [Nanohaloarchaea archaeon SW_7_43_1]|nr:MAG: hypothetical protein BRC29_00775 [Nanohaloarchaea archaeon SW_7_43_1]